MNRDPAVGGSDEIPLSAGPPTAPRIWVLMGHRAGDNSQLSALADGLGWPYEVKRFVHRRLEVVTNVLFDATLLGSIASRSSPLGPTWSSRRGAGANPSRAGSVVTPTTP
jgi:hypothetical protein